METFTGGDLGRAQNSILHVYDMETGTDTVLTTLPRVAEAPFWTKDGTALLYNSRGRIYRYTLADGTTEPVDTGAAQYLNNDHVLSPDGTALAVSGNTADSWISYIYVVPLDTGKERCVVDRPLSYLHGWSPDGQTLAYCAGRDYGNGIEMDIYTCPVRGGQETRLTDAPGLNDGPEYSADGRTIWFNSVRTGRMQVWKMDADGANQTQVTFDEDWNAWFPHISPDMQKVVYIVYHKDDLDPGAHIPDLNVQLRLMNADGTDCRTIARLFGGQGTINVNSWSPDSKRIAYFSYAK